MDKKIKTKSKKKQKLKKSSEILGKIDFLRKLEYSEIAGFSSNVYLYDDL